MEVGGNERYKEKIFFRHNKYTKVLKAKDFLRKEDSNNKIYHLLSI